MLCSLTPDQLLLICVALNNLGTTPALRLREQLESGELTVSPGQALAAQGAGSAARSRASRENGKKGGRPRKNKEVS